MSQEVVAHWIAECRLSIEQARLLTLKAASKIDAVGNRKARKEVTCPLTALCLRMGGVIPAIQRADAELSHPLGVSFRARLQVEERQPEGSREAGQRSLPQSKRTDV